MRTRLAIALCCAGLWSTSPAAWASSPGQVAQDDEPVRALILKLEQAVRSGDPAAYLALLGDSADRHRAEDFAAAEIHPGATRVVVRERGRVAAPGAPAGSGYRLIVEAFVEVGGRARAARWRLDIRRTTENSWVVADEERLAALDHLYRLAINSSKQFAARDFTIRAEDLDLTLADGSVFTVDSDQGVTGLVLIGHGTMHFHPAPQVEKGQMRIFAGSETLDSPFEVAFVRVGSLESHADMSRLAARTVDPRDLRRAEDVFREESPKTFMIDLGDVTDARWSTLPPASDIVAEVRTRRFGTLTYSRSEDQEEDISLFDRAKQKNISVYASADRLAARGRFYDEDALAEYDVLDYEIDLAFDPVPRMFDSRARLKLRTRSALVSQITLRLADTLTVRSVSSDEFGRLHSVRVPGQNTLLVTLPAPVPQGTDLTIALEYAGRVGPQPIEWETLPFTQRELDALADTPNAVTQGRSPETNYLYGNRSYWYPRATVFDYATATLRIWVPADFDCLATGELAPNSPAVDDTDPARRRKLYLFTAERPIRYLSFLVTRLAPVERATVAFNDDEDVPGRVRGPAMGGAVYNTLNLTVMAHVPAVAKARTLAAEAVDIAQFYRSIVGDSPYSSLTLALVEGTAPGDHSPGYFTAVRRPSEGAPPLLRNDPASVDDYPEFFPAHAIAHQWWGQAVGWKTYHDQWLSESFAQYFAALYTGHQRGDEAFRVIMRQMRKWGIDESAQGPLFLGYRLGHVRDEGRVFRALVYDKGAAVLHMLRHLVGDDAFFLGVRRFYASWRYQKAGTEDLRAAMEAESGRSLETFFERWIYGSSLPQLTFSYRVEDERAAGHGREILLRVDQTGELFDVPVTVVLQYADHPPSEVIMAVSARTTEMRVPLAGTIRRVDISKDDGTLADVQKH